MKFSLIVAVVVLALAQGSFAQDAPVDLAKINQYFEEMKTKVTQELTQLIQSQDLASKAQALQTQLEPLATQIQDQLRTVAANVEEQIKPMAAGMQDQMQPVMDNFQKQLESIFQSLTEQARAIAN